MSILTLAQKIQLHMPIPEHDKKQAKECIILLNKLSKLIINLNKYLNLIYDPFKKYSEVSEESILKYRGALWKYANEIKDKFDSEDQNSLGIKILAAKVVDKLNIFHSDTKIKELKNSFIGNIEGIRKQCITTYNAIINWDSADYKDIVIKAIELLKKELTEAKNVIFDRMINHLNEHILSSNWLNSVKDFELKEVEPYLVQLYKSREKQ